MKALLLSALTLAGLPLLAQTPPPATPSAPSTPSTPPSATQPATRPSPAAMMAQVASVLTPEEKDRLTAAHAKAVADNPSLQTEAMDLMQKNMALQSGTATDADKESFRAAATAYGVKVRAAMLKADPTIEPVLRKEEAEVAKLRAEYGLGH